MAPEVVKGGDAGHDFVSFFFIELLRYDFIFLLDG